jgi:NAD-specific glutamate dehydrogenase
MAELVGILASAATIAELGAQSSLALFKVISTIKNAREEISQIAAEMSDLSGTVVMLQHLLESYRHVYTTTLLDRVRSILQRFDQVDKDLKKLTGKKKKLKSLRWFFEGPKAKGLLRKVEGIKSSLSLVINIILLAADQASRV